MKRLYQISKIKMQNDKSNFKKDSAIRHPGAKQDEYQLVSGSHEMLN
jgi:hypothetical protein